VGTAAAVVLPRRAPAVALGLAWVIGILQVNSQTPILLIEGALAVVAFGVARWGRPATVVAAGLSTLAAPILVVLMVREPFLYPVFNPTASDVSFRAATRLGTTWEIVLGIATLAILGLPFLAGLATRFLDQAIEARRSMARAELEAARAHREMEQAQEIARLRAEQSRLARDVHDVVGHSLAVILAQAESAQYFDDRDTARLKATMATIADSARGSLRDVRQVLTPAAPRTQPRPDGLDSLLDGLRAAGHEVDSTEFGTAQPLPPDLDVVAHRVLQEMLTNAIKYGRRDHPVRVERHWGDFGGDLRLEVSNIVDELSDGGPDEAVDPAPSGLDRGQGLLGMRRRLDAVGGRIDVRRRRSPDGTVFTATAWVPVRTGGG